MHEVADLTGITIRALHYYDEIGLLKPTMVTDSKYRLYSNDDLSRLQEILFFREVGFSLKEISNMTIHDTSSDILESLKMQIDLVQKKIENMNQMEHALQNTMQIVQQTNQIDWNEILNLIHLTDMEKTLVEQYKNGANLNIRIALHEQYSTNPKGWFPWLYEQIDFTGVQNLLEV